MREGVEVVKFKVGDKVRVPGDPSGEWRVIEEERNTYGVMHYWAGDDWYEEDDLENESHLGEAHDSVDRPTHYESGGKDLFDELYDRLYHSKKMFTGREVFIIVMKFVAERYTRRYPNKNAEDLSKGIYTLERLKEYEENEK